LSDLGQVGFRCDAWRAFLESDTAAQFAKLKGHILWFNRYESFDKLLMEFTCSRKALRTAILSLMRPGNVLPVSFVRRDIYDSRGWATFPLTCFVPVEGLQPRTHEPQWQSEVLPLGEVPEISFGIPMPWMVSQDCFSLHQRTKRGQRLTVMTFDHPSLDRRFNGRRWCAEMVFAAGTPSSEKRERLLETVRRECKKHMVTII
jgi:hypothetical protein